MGAEFWTNGTEICEKNLQTHGPTGTNIRASRMGNHACRAPIFDKGCRNFEEFLFILGAVWGDVRHRWHAGLRIGRGISRTCGHPRGSAR